MLHWLARNVRLMPIARQTPPAVALSVLFVVATAGGGFAAELSGTVINAAGESVAGVPVRLLTSDYTSLTPIDLGRTQTDASGRFRIEVPDRWFEFPEPWRQELTLLAEAADGSLGGALVYRSPPLPRRRLTIRLEDFTPQKIAVVDADQKPVAGATLRLTGVLFPIIRPAPFQQTPGDLQVTPIPMDESAPPATTDADGIVELPLPPRELIGALRLDLGDAIGVDWSVIGNNAAVPKDWSQRLAVPRLTTIPIHVDAASKAALDDLNLTAISQARQSNFPITVVRSRAQLGAEGNATIQSLHDAIVRFSAVTPQFPDFRLDKPFIENSATLGSEVLQLRYRAGVIVTGRAVATDGSPAADTTLFAFGGFSPAARIRTDAEGRYRFVTSPGQAFVTPAGLSGYRGNPIDPQSVPVVPESSLTFELPVLQLTRLHTLAGTVRDSDQRPVAGASVLAMWNEPHPQLRQAIANREEVIMTAVDGSFAIAGVDPDSPVRVAAWHNGEFGSAIQSVAAADHGKPLQLEISTEFSIAAAGRVVDAAGRGIPNVAVVVRHRIETPLDDAGAPTGEDLVDGNLMTDANGRYATRKNLPPWGAYIAVALPGRPQETASGWKAAAAKSPLQLPDIIAATRTEISGSVVTTDGKAISGADVVLLTSDGRSKARTDENGRFTIAAIGGKGPLLIASMEGFFANGVELNKGPDSVTLTLPRESELAAPAAGAKEGAADQPPRGLSADERRQLAIRLSETHAPTNPQLRARLFSALARIAPDYVRPKLDKWPAGDETAAMVRFSLARSLAADRPEEARELLDQISDPIMRLITLVNLEPALNLADDERLQLLAQVVQDGRGLASADFRVIGLGFAGERLLDLGQREQGTALLREGQALAEKLAPAAYSGYARGAFAEELAQIDADAALKLIEPLTDASEFNRHLTNMAHELGAIDPARAAALLDRMRPPDPQRQPIASNRDLAALRVCYRMVRVDADRATALADSLEGDVMRIHCRGLMAESLLKQDGATAESRALADRLLAEAWSNLSEFGRTHNQEEIAYLFPSTIAALLLPLSAELHPEQLPYRVWQAIALQRPPVKSGSYRYAGQNCTSELALLLAEVDPAAARRLLAWTPNPTGGETSFAEFVQYSRTAPELIVILAPETIDASLNTVQDQAPRERLALQFVGALSRSGESRQRAIRNEAALWFPDDEDLGPQD
jgi:hypothetical protein